MLKILEPMWTEKPETASPLRNQLNWSSMQQRLEISALAKIPLDGEDAWTSVCLPAKKCVLWNITQPSHGANFPRLWRLLKKHKI
ncbi:hypothetical protein HA62_16625 [Pseudomonas putida]|nr:hypothetical protein HA62_16625 [Pseudomonas putida]